MNANCNHQLINDLLLWLENIIKGIEIFVNNWFYIHFVL